MINYHVTGQNDPYNLAVGGVVYAHDKVLLLSRANDGRKTYHLPKGTLEPGESIEDCARREILEESGAVVQLEYYLGGIHAQFEFDGKPADKIILYYAAKLKSDKLQDMDDEHDGREWFPVGQAEQLLKLNHNPKQEWLIISRFKAWLELNPQDD